MKLFDPSTDFIRFEFLLNPSDAGDGPSHGEVLANREMRKDPFALSVLTHVTGARMILEHRAQKLRAAGADESGDAEDLAAAKTHAVRIQNHVAGRMRMRFAENGLHLSTHHLCDER